MKAKSAVWLLVLVSSAWTSDALTIHRSFRTRDVGFGGGASVSVPVDAKVSKAIDEGRQAVRKELRIVGRVTRVADGGTVVVTPNGGSSTTVRLRNINAPEPDQPGGEQAKSFLKDLVYGERVEVQYAERDVRGRVLGTVYRKRGKSLVDVNLTMILNGWARHDDSVGANARIPAYDDAERAARQAKKGLWTGEK